MRYSLDAGCWNSVMAVPACVVDEYIKLCSGNALKLLLFLLRHGGQGYTPEQLCEKLGIRDTGDIEDAAEFWVQRGLIKIDRSRTSDERTVAVPAEKAKQTGATEQLTLSDIGKEAAAPEPAKPVSMKKVGSDLGLYYSNGDINARIKNDPQIAYLFKEAEQLFGHALKSKDSQTVIALTDTIGLPAEVAIMALSYCFKVGKTTPGFILKLAQNWADDGIDTLDAADKKLKQLEKQDSVEYALRREMELTGKMSKEMKEFIRCWTEDWGFDTEMIMLSYEITLNNIGKVSFKYMNRTLENWHNDGVSTPEAAASKSAERKTVKNTAAASGGNSSFDMEDVLAQIRSKYNNS